MIDQGSTSHTWARNSQGQYDGDPPRYDWICTTCGKTEQSTVPTVETCPFRVMELRRAQNAQPQTP
jgi:hypothetical protein